MSLDTSYKVVQITYNGELYPLDSGKINNQKRTVQSNISDEDIIVSYEDGYTGLESVTITPIKKIDKDKLEESGLLIWKNINETTSGLEATITAKLNIDSDNYGYIDSDGASVIKAATVTAKDVTTKEVYKISSGGEYDVTNYQTVSVILPSSYQNKIIEDLETLDTIYPDAGYNALNTVTINSVKNLSPENVRSGINILGTEGGYKPFQFTIWGE